jgi:peptide-methionine (S)-S-oxide reductase
LLVGSTLCGLSLSACSKHDSEAQAAERLQDEARRESQQAEQIARLKPVGYSSNANDVNKTNNTSNTSNTSNQAGSPPSGSANSSTLTDKTMNTADHAIAANTANTSPAAPSGKTEQATFGAGCFWCVEAVYQRLEGVKKVVSGYAGGATKNPTYKEVCSGETGHAEVCQITYDPAVVSYTELLEVFWQVHDPTTLNRQGNDVGTQYRSVIYFHNEEQRKLAEEYKKKLGAANIWKDPIVTEISPLTVFYGGEDYHQNYFNDNGQQPYCAVVVRPKVEKFEKVFKSKLKKH